MSAEKITRLGLLSFLFFLFIISRVATASVDEQILVDIPWLVKHKNDEQLIVVDARPEKEFLAGHIAGSVNIPVNKTFNPTHDKDRVGNLQHIQTLFRNASIRNDHTVVIYDDNSYIDAGRLFWVFEVYGHRQVKLLNGGISGWREHSGEALSQSVSVLKKSDYIPEIEPDRLITKFSMRLALDDKSKVVIDARAAEEYKGKKSIAARTGHIPGAINIPWDNNFVEIDGIKMMRPVADLKMLYKDIAADKRIYLYCNKGKQSSLSYTVMRQLGYDAAHYDGSWFEWGNDSTLPIAKP